MSALTAQLIAHFNSLAAERGEAVAYRRGGVVVIPSLTLVPGRFGRTIVSDQGANVYVNATEWIGLGSALATVMPPVSDDEIVMGDKVWRVSKLGAEGTYRKCDAMGTMIRIFTKESKVAE